MGNPYKLKKNTGLIVNTIIEAAGYVFCQRCGRASPSIFDAHHIVYRSEAPKHPNLHHQDNILLCCPDCHKQLHKKKSLRRRIVLERKLYELFPEILSLRP